MTQNLVLHVNGPNGLVPFQIQTAIDGQEVLANLAVVSKIAQDYAKNSRSKNTVKSYSSDWKDFDFWCQSRELKSMPADPRTVACYLADRASQSFIDHQGTKQNPLKTSTLARRRRRRVKHRLQTSQMAVCVPSPRGATQSEPT